MSFAESLQEHLDTLKAVKGLELQIAQAAGLMAAALSLGGKLMFCGNGGSAADSQHIASELTGRFVMDRAPMAAIALTTDASALTAIANDYAFAEVFARQVKALGKPGDCLVAISTSGMSENVLAAVRQAKAIGIRTIGLLGCGGGRVGLLCDVAIIVPSNKTARIQEAHGFIGHMLCELMGA